MKTLITEVLPQQEGYDTKHEIELPSGISWELRFYCNCGEEITEDEIIEHAKRCPECEEP